MKHPTYAAIKICKNNKSKSHIYLAPDEVIRLFIFLTALWSTQEGEQRFDNHIDKLLNYIRFWQADGESEKTSMHISVFINALYGKQLSIVMFIIQI